MIDHTLEIVLSELNKFLEVRFPNGGKSQAVLSSLADLDGAIPEEITDKVVLTLVNVERENAAASGSPKMRVEGDMFTRINPSLNLNLYLLVSVSFQKYPESFKALSAVLAFFQANPLFTAESVPKFPKGLEKLSFELVNLDFQSLNNLWSVLGGKYLPSVIYKARMLTIQEGWVVEKVPVVTGTDVEL